MKMASSRECSPDVGRGAEEEEEEEERRGEGEEEIKGREEDETVLKFLDSLDAYLSLLNSLSATLRQGWLELASARHSMGTSRISSTLLDLKVKSAATVLQVENSIDESQSVSQPHFMLSKWVLARKENHSSKDKDSESWQKKSATQLRHRGPSHFSDKAADNSEESYSATNESPIIVDNNIQKERSKSLSVFGTLVSPKLRAAQVSFETALETIVEVANMRSSMLSAYSQLQPESEC